MFDPLQVYLLLRQHDPHEDAERGTIMAYCGFRFDLEDSLNGTVDVVYWYVFPSRKSGTDRKLRAAG